ncbi:MAG: hypothetical protein AMXMBFR64_01920 [Myxococcales bacterium]
MRPRCGAALLALFVAACDGDVGPAGATGADAADAATVADGASQVDGHGDTVGSDASSADDSAGSPESDSISALDARVGPDVPAADTAGTSDGSDTGADAAGGCTTIVDPDQGGAALQAALIAAASGDVVCLGQGTFDVQSELSLTTGGVTIRGWGMDASVLSYTNQVVGANGLKITGNNVTLEDFGLVDPAGDGVRADAVSGLTLRGVSVRWTTPASGDNGGYGLYPVQSQDVLVEGCVVVGASDAGIYVGQSTNVLVRHNEAMGNVAGIEIENTTDAEVVDNNVHDNTAGILVFNLPGLPVQDGKRAKVHDNQVTNNNGMNFAQEGNIVAMVPSGTGIMVLASDDNEIHDNQIAGNQTVGVLIIHYADMLFGAPTDPDFDPYPEGNWVHGNTLADNGASPQGIAAALPIPKPMAPLAWDGCTDPAKGDDAALRNCFSSNGDAAFVDFDLCGGFADVSSDATPVTCEHSTLPAIDLPGAAP